VPTMRRALLQRRLCGAITIFWLSVATAVGSLAEQEFRSADLRGAWRAEDGALVRFEPDRVITFEGGQVTIGRIVGRDRDKLKLRRGGLLESWRISASEGLLRIERSGKITAYKALAEVPPAVDLKPFELPRPGDLPLSLVKEVQSELAERLRKDQATLKSETQRHAVIAENLAFLEALVRKVGWIDAGRFGRQAAANAVILAKHGEDLPLIMAAMPSVEADFKHAGDDAQMYTIFYDELMIELGGKQRYGTQLAEDAQRAPFVLPLEDRARVDEWRKEIGLVPLADYLAVASKYLYKGHPIRLPRDDE
jgi:hypothetical protein